MIIHHGPLERLTLKSSLLINSETVLRINNDIKKGMDRGSVCTSWIWFQHATMAFITFCSYCCHCIQRIVSVLNTASNRDVKTSLHTFKHYLKCSDRNLYICLDAILKA